MYRLKEIQQSFDNLVGWNQPYNRNHQLSDQLTQSESGHYFDEEHPLLTINNVRSTMPVDYYEKYNPYDMNKVYSIGDKVLHSGKVYISLEDKNSSDPGNSDQWEKYSIENDYLEEMKLKSIANVIKEFHCRKLNEYETKNMIDKFYLFDGSGRKTNTIDNRDRLVGFEIRSLHGQGVTTILEKIGLQMDGKVPNLTLYVFHTSQEEPIYTFNINQVNSNTFEWHKLKECFLPYQSKNTNSGGTWYIVYNQSDLDLVNAVNLDRNFNNYTGCSSCSQFAYQYYTEISKHIQIRPFYYQNEVDHSDPKLWDVTMNIYTPTINYGMNLCVSVCCDITDIIISDRFAFVDVLCKQGAYDFLKIMDTNPNTRINQNIENAGRLDLTYELDGNVGTTNRGLASRLRHAYDGLHLETKGLDHICLSCNEWGVSFGTL